MLDLTTYLITKDLAGGPILVQEYAPLHQFECNDDVSVEQSSVDLIVRIVGAAVGLSIIAYIFIAL